MTKRNYDATVARIAGNIASGILSEGVADLGQNNQKLGPLTPQGQKLVDLCVMLARAIVAEVQRTEPFW